MANNQASPRPASWRNKRPRQTRDNRFDNGSGIFGSTREVLCRKPSFFIFFFKGIAAQQQWQGSICRTGTDGERRHNRGGHQAECGFNAFRERVYHGVQRACRTHCAGKAEGAEDGRTKLLNIEMAPPRSSKRETSDDSVGRLSPVSIASLKPLTTDSPTDDAVNC